MISGGHLTKRILVRNGLVLGRALSTAPGVLPFQDLYKDLKERLDRSCLNSTQRSLVYRPSKAVALTTRPEPILVNGEILVPKVWRGAPGKKDLIRCIRQISTEDEFCKAKEVIRLYHAHYPEKLNSRHAIRFLRQGATIGKFNESLTFTRSSNLSSTLDDEFHKELVRLHAIRLEFFNKGEDKRSAFLSMFDGSTGLEYALLRFVGVSNLMRSSADQVTDALRDAFERASKEANAYMDDISLEHELAMPKPKQRSFLVTIALGVQHLELWQQDPSKLNKLIEASGESNVRRFTNSYLEQLQKGFEKEQLQVR